MVAVRHLEFVLAVWTIHEGHLAVFITVQNLAGIHAVVSIKCMSSRVWLKMAIPAPKTPFWGRQRNP